MHLEIGFCEHFCVGMTFLIPGTIGKGSWVKNIPSWRSCVYYEQLFHLVQWSVCRRCHCSSRDKFFLPKVTGILWTLDQLHYLWGINCFGNDHDTTFNLSVSVWKFTHTFLPPLYIVHFRQDISYAVSSRQLNIVVGDWESHVALI